MLGIDYNIRLSKIRGLYFHVPGSAGGSEVIPSHCGTGVFVFCACFPTCGMIPRRDTAGKSTRIQDYLRWTRQTRG